MNNIPGITNKLSSILLLGFKNQQLISRSLDLRIIEEAKRFQHVDSYLSALLQKAVRFDFVGQVAKGTTLLVGEGNLSFTLSLTRKRRIDPAKLTATTYEKETELSPAARINATALKSRGARVLYGIDSSNLSNAFTSRFDTIIFQFPHAGTREPVNGNNPNFILVVNFLRSAARILTNDGRVLLSAVDTPHYRGAFQFEKVAHEAGFEAPEVYPFDPASFQGYTHSMTHQNGSALADHSNFSTWVFRLK